LPLVATNDLHYTKPEDSVAHAALLCVQSGSTLSDPNRFKFDANEFYVKTAAEMREVWKDLPEACDNTLLIAEQCDVTFTEGEGRFMPRFPCPEGHNEESWFVAEVETGLHKRYPEGVPDHVRKQAEYEIEVIVSKGYAGYFLVVADFINWAKNNGIRVGPGRGSGAGSMCAYAMRITDLDPLRHGLIFERFLNPERMSMPDFDIDFDDRRRPEVIRYVTEKYGDDRVAMIVTYGTIKAKQAVKDAARVLGFPFSMGERVTKVMPPPVMGKDVPLNKIFDKSHDRYGEGGEFRALYEADSEVKTVVDTAKGLEGGTRVPGDLLAVPHREHNRRTRSRVHQDLRGAQPRGPGQFRQQHPAQENDRVLEPSGLQLHTAHPHGRAARRPAEPDRRRDFVLFRGDGAAGEQLGFPTNLRQNCLTGVQRFIPVRGGHDTPAVPINEGDQAAVAHRGFHRRPVAALDVVQDGRGLVAVAEDRVHPDVHCRVPILCVPRPPKPRPEVAVPTISSLAKYATGTGQPTTRPQYPNTF